MMYDLTGKKFNDLTVIERSKGISGKAGTYWDCKCICGEVVPYRSDMLRKRNVKNCGCTSGSVKIGQKAWHLTVVERLGKINGKRSLWWKCQCECGNFVELTSYSIKDGYIKSCGCIANPIGKRHPNFVGYEDISGNYFNRVKKNADLRNLPFKISIKQMWELFEEQKRKCALSGLDLQFGVNSRIKEKKRECTASLDRIDNSKGYTIDNVQWLHKDINKMKNTHSQEYFINICKKIAESS